MDDGQGVTKDLVGVVPIDESDTDAAQALQSFINHSLHRQCDERLASLSLPDVDNLPLEEKMKLVILFFGEFNGEESDAEQP